MNSFVVNYDLKTLSIKFEEENFNFNLNDGDVGDYWNSFTTKDGVIKDINFYQDDKKEVPNVAVYAVKPTGKKKELLIDTSDYVTIDEYTQEGNPKNYFGF